MRPARFRLTVPRSRSARRRESAGCRRNLRSACRRSCDSRHAAVLKQDFPGRAGAHAELVFFLADAKSRRVLFDDERRNAVLRGRAIGHEHRDTDVGVMRIRRERFAAVQHPFVAVPDRRASGPGRVGSGFRLGQRPAADPLARRELRDISLALLVVGGSEDVIRAERIMRGDDQPDRRVDPRKLLDDDRVIDVAESRAAQFFGEDDSEDIRARRTS